VYTLISEDFKMNWKLKAKIFERFGSQADFAAVSGVDETVISRVVRMRRELPDDEQRRWAKLLKCKREVIFNG
jgi:hypothetical protein